MHSRVMPVFCHVTLEQTTLIVGWAGSVLMANAAAGNDAVRRDTAVNS